MLSKELLKNLYLGGYSMMDIARKYNISTNKVSYWMDRHGIKRRSISEAIYRKNNPNGNPFKLKEPRTEYERFLLGLGFGLFWGEGNRATKAGIRLGNTDPFLIIYFRDFLEIICGVQQKKIKYSLQIFGDIDRNEAITFWCKMLSLQTEQIKTSIIQWRGKGNYRNKNRYGVMQIACHNTKLKTIFDDIFSTLKTRSMPT